MAIELVKAIKKADISKYIGYQAEPSDWFVVSQKNIDQFADCTLDHQFIHVDELAAKNGPFGATIAHGFLTLSMLSYFAKHQSVLIEGYQLGINAGFDKVRFIHPVKVNSRIRGHAKIIAIKERKLGQFSFTTEVTVEIENVKKPALIAEWLTIQITSDD